MLSPQRIARLIVCLSIPVACGSLWAAEPTADGTRSAPATECWKQIAPLFTPPKEFAGDFGRFRTPLGFYNGDMVHTSADWQRRRQEILTRWQSLLGKWPPIIEKPKLEIVKTSRRENFVQHQVRFQWLPNEMTDGYLLVPDGEGARPAVLVVYYEPETAIGEGKEYRDFAYQLTKRGFVTLSMGNRAGTDAKTYGVYYPSLKKAEIQPLSGLAYTAANAYHVLAGRKEVDPRRVGVVGHSFGGKWAMFASCLYDKFACAVWSDPGIVFNSTRGSINYWEPWYLGYEPGRWRTRGMVTAANPCFGLYPRLVAEGYDLHELHALMAPRPFLVSGGSEDPPQQWRALNHTIRVNELLGCKNRVAMSNRPEHSPNAQSNEQIYSFFEHFLKDGGKERSVTRDRRWWDGVGWPGHSSAKRWSIRKRSAGRCVRVAQPQEVSCTCTLCNSSCRSFNRKPKACTPGRPDGEATRGESHVHLLSLRDPDTFSGHLEQCSSVFSGKVSGPPNA